MALEHALLVALRERPASGLELARRFDRSIGFFWHATHQQIYRVLGRMESDGWVRVKTVAQQGRPDKKVYDVAPAGRGHVEQEQQVHGRALSRTRAGASRPSAGAAGRRP